MTKLQLLHRALNERLMAAVEQIMEMVGGTVLEYEEETIRARKENEVLRRRLRWMEGANPADWPGPSESITLSTPDESNPSRQDESAPNFGLGQESEGLVIKTETTDHPLYSGTTLPQSNDQGSDIAGTSTGIGYSLVGGMTWDSAQNYMAPLDFDPTSGTTRVGQWRGQNRRQRMSFACPDCGKVFGREHSLMIHMRIHSAERPYMYRRRKAFFYGDNKKRKRQGLSQKQRKNDAAKKDKVAGESVFPCPKCDRVCASATRLRLHMKSHRSEKALLCKRLKMIIQTEPCKAETTKVVPKTTEVQNLQELKKTYACPHCDKVFIREGWLEPHIRTQHRTKQFWRSQFDSGQTRAQLLYSQGPEDQSNSTDDLLKIHHCYYCKQPHYRMMDHLQSVHPNESEVAKALTFDKSSQERKDLLNLLQTKGNVLHSTNVVQSSKQDSNPFRSFASDCSFDDSVYCIYCLGLFNKKTFATHLEQCTGKSTDSAEACFGEILLNAGPVPPPPTLTSPWSPEEIDANLEPSGFHWLNTTYGTEQLNLDNEQGSSSHQDVTCSVGQPDVSSPNDGQTEGANLQFKHSLENEVSYDFRSFSFPNPSTGQESPDCKNEEISLPKCDDPERTVTATSNTCSIKAHPEYNVLRNPFDDFSPPHSNRTVSNDNVKAQSHGKGRKKMRKKRHSGVQNKSLSMVNDLLGEGEMPSSKIHVCQHCRATFCSSYTLRRHEYTHTGERPFWCHHCNLGFIQKYRLLKHTFAYHGNTSTNTDQEKPKRPKRKIPGGEKSVKDETNLEPSAKSPVNDETEENVAATMQDTEAREFHWEEAGHSKVKD